jgi:cystathionine beta-synthase
MRENGFLDRERPSARVSDLLSDKGGQVYTATLGQQIDEVVGVMKEHGISQLPVLDGGRVVGIINETDVLNHLLSGGKREDKIDDLVEAGFAIVEPSNRLNLVGQFFKQNKIVIVVGDDGELAGIITKIDFIDYVSVQL